MATIKSYTDLEQSKKLMEILPIESADMYYGYGKDKPEFLPYSDVEVKKLCLPCWSLAALLNIIKRTIGYRMESFDCENSTIHCDLGDKPWFIDSGEYENEVDSCYEMILMLHEFTML